MFVKLAVLFCVVAATLGAYSGPLAGGTPAAQYPAGINPAACPNYPHCTNPALAANPGAPATNAYFGAPQYNQDAYNQHAYNPQLFNPQAFNVQAHNQQIYNPQAFNVQPHNPQIYNQQAYNPQGYGNPVSNTLLAGGYTGDGDYHGEGLAEAGSFGDISHQYNSAPGYNAAPVPAHYNTGHYGQAQPAALPAGVDASSCPNYPYCH